MATKNIKETDMSYQELQSELNEAMAQLETTDIDIDEAVAAYERGLDIIKQLEERIVHAENRVSKLRASRSKDDL